MFRPLLSSILALSLLLPYGVGASDLDPVFKAVKPLQIPQVLMDENGQPTDVTILRNICTTTSINQKAKLWLTAAHCILWAKDGQKFYIDKQLAFVWDVTKDLDLAIMMVPGLNVKGLRLGTEPNIGDAALVVGHPLGIPEPQLFQGHIASMGTMVPELSKVPYMMFDMYGCQGNSGSAILDSNLDIISVVQIGTSQPCSGWMGGIQWSSLKGWAKKYFK